MLADTPVIAWGSGRAAGPAEFKSIGTVFQDPEPLAGDRVFLKFGDQQLTYHDANTANRYAAVAARGVGPGASCCVTHPAQS